MHLCIACARMKERENWTTEQIITVLEANGGIVLYAAQKLGVHRNTLSRWIKTEPALAEATGNTVEMLLDIGEANIIKGLKAGSWEETRFYMSTKGRSRGYGIKAEITGKDGGPVMMATEPPIDFTKLSTKEIETYLALVDKAKPSQE